MKIRKGFVTNSSSTNFGTILVTSIGSIGITSILNAFNIDINAKKKSYVRLVVEAPKNKVVKPGDTISLNGEVVMIEIIDGKVSGAPTVVGAAKINCISGERFVDTDGTYYYVTTDKNRIKDSGGAMSFEVSAEYEGQKMAAVVDFYLAEFSINPQEGVFVVGKKTEQPLKLKANTQASFSNNIEVEYLSSEIVFEDGKTLDLKLIENIQEPTKFFNKSTCVINKYIKLQADFGSVIMEKPYLAKFLNESILVPKQLKEPINIKCYKDEEQSKRIDMAFILPIKVVTYSKDKDTLITDIELTNNLVFEFFPKAGHKYLNNEQTRKAVNDAKIIAELVPNDGEATLTKPYARYRIYADALAEAETDRIDIGIRISCNGDGIEDISLDGVLLPKINIKGLIKQFIDYPNGTYIGTLIKLGNVDTYMEALDYLSEIRLISSGDPKYHPGKNVMFLNKIPEGIHEFALVQTIHHEIAHIIEEQNDDESGTTEWDERHSYFIEHLSNVTYHLSRMERGIEPVEDAIIGAIESFGFVFFNFANKAHPVDRGEVLSWFGAKTLTQHEVFNKYLDFNIYALNSNLSDEVISEISKTVARCYFPGNVMGRWKESGGAFNGMTWRISWNEGRLNKLTPESSAYTFTELSRKWAGGNKLQFEIRYFVVRNSDQDEDEVIAVFDAGTFDPTDYHFPSVNKMTIKWKAGRTLSECILGNHIDQETTLTRI